jgi:tetratricopeptide (TPR) repeat protein
MRQSLIVSALGLALAAASLASARAQTAPVPAASAATPAPIAPSCLPEIAKAEKRYGIPEGLLVSISLVESGRSDPDTGIVSPWPWTIDSHGEGQYFDSIDTAAAAAGKLLAGNDALVDVGCMQVDLYHHPHAFQTLLAAFDPETNVDYAARYLVQLKGQSGSWASAIGAYHTGNPETGGEYVARVLYYWKNLGTTATTARVIAEKPGLRGFVIDARPAPLEIAAGFVESKDYPSAAAIYRAILAGAPDDQMAMLGLAQTMQATGHDGEAREQLERLLTENPGNHAGLAALLAILDGLPPPQRLTALLSARQVVPNSGQIPARVAILEQERGNTKEALAQMGAAVRLEPGDPILRLDYALMLDKGGYRDASIAAYTQFLEHYRPGSVALTVSLDQIKQRLFYLRAHTP